MQTKRLPTALNPYLFRLYLAIGCLLCAVALYAQPQQLLEQADSLADLEQYEAANEKLITFIKTYPQRKYDLGEAYCKRARNCFCLKKLEQAATYNKASVAIRTDIAPDALGWNEKLLARIKLAQGAYAEALRHASEAADYPYFDDPLVPAEIALLQSEIHQRMGAYNDALEAAEVAREIVNIIDGPEALMLADIHLQRSKLLAVQQRWPESAAASRSAIALENSPKGNLLLGQALLATDPSSREAKKHLAFAQKRGLPPVQLEASLALARLELANKRFYGVIAQLDRTDPLINERLSGKGNESTLHTLHDHDYGTAAAQSAYLRACAWLLEPSDEAPMRAFHFAKKGLEALEGTDVQLQQQLLEQGYLALIRLQDSASQPDSLHADLWDWTQQYLEHQPLIDSMPHCEAFTLDWQAFRAALPKKSAAVLFLEGVQSDFAIYAFEDDLQLHQLTDQVFDATGTTLNKATAAATFSSLFSPLENYSSPLKKLLLLTPPDWPKADVLNMPVPSSVKTGIWPFRQKVQLLNKRYEVLQYCGVTPRASLENQGKDSLHRH